MKRIVLVIDDTTNNQESARQTIDREKYELTIASSVDEAMKLLGCKSRGSFYASKYETGFDVVLTDLMLPVSMTNLAPKNCPDPYSQYAYGYAIALKAIMLGVKFVAIVSNACHHSDPMSSIMDAFNTMGVVNGITLLGECEMVELKGGGHGKNWGATLEHLLADRSNTGPLPKSERPKYLDQEGDGLMGLVDE